MIWPFLVYALHPREVAHPQAMRWRSWACSSCSRCWPTSGSRRGRTRRCSSSCPPGRGSSSPARCSPSPAVKIAAHPLAHTGHRRLDRPAADRLLRRHLHDTRTSAPRRSLPVLGTVAIVAASTVRPRRSSPAKLLGAKPMVWIGRSLVRHLPLALAGPGAPRRQVRAAVGADPGGRPARRRSGPPRSPTTSSRTRSATPTGCRRLPRAAWPSAGRSSSSACSPACSPSHFPTQDVSDGGVVAAPTLPGQTVGVTDPRSAASTGGDTVGHRHVGRRGDTDHTRRPPARGADAILVTPIGGSCSARSGPRSTRRPRSPRCPRTPRHRWRSPRATSRGSTATNCVLKDGDATRAELRVRRPERHHHGDRPLRRFARRAVVPRARATGARASTGSSMVYVKCGCPTADVRIRKHLPRPRVRRVAHERGRPARRRSIRRCW